MRSLRMNQIPDVCVMLRLIQQRMCSKFAAPRQHRKFPTYQIFDVGIGSRPGTKIYRERGAARVPGYEAPGVGIFLLRKLWRPRRKLLVLRLRRQALVGLGVVDHLTQKLLAERRQRAFPQLPRSFALFDETPLLRADGAGAPAVGEMVDGAAGDRIAFADFPFDRRNAAMPRPQRGGIADTT